MIRLKDFPDHHDAELVMKLYDLRREAIMRESRSAVNGKFWPKNAEEATAVTKSDSPLHAAFRQVSTYWEMAYGMAKHGVLHTEFMLESNGEGIYLFARVEPYLADFRKLNPRAFKNAEWITTECEDGRHLLDVYRARVQQVLASK
ncbi:MAG: hypothetical protein ABI877_14825 [Gemmatimonadaceae bacterium]